jgi:hypothetical protein
MATLVTTPIKTFVSGETVTPTKLNELSQPTVALTAGTIVAADIATDAVTTAKILDANVTTAKLADSAVTTAKINNAAITAAKLDGAQAGSAPIYGCRAWVNFDGTKDTTGAASTANTNRLIRGSGNVTSVLRNGVGDYTVTFSTPMPDANYAAIVTADINFSAIYGAGAFGAVSSAASLRVGTQALSTGAAGDRGQVFVAIFR